FVQVVHYPLFALVPAEASPGYAAEHQRRTALVVGAPMAVEGVSVLWLFAAPPDGLGRGLPTLGGLVLAVVLASTVLAQVPRHGRLAGETDADRIGDVVAGLVRSNWVRTTGWSARAVLATAMVVIVAGAS
ncbi:MAG: hypothetical protein RIR49_684, partial [Actinomycetota bacterium]